MLIITPIESKQKLLVFFQKLPKPFFLLRSLKKVCQRMRPVPGNPTYLPDFVINDNLYTLGGDFLIFDSDDGLIEFLELRKITTFYHFLLYGWRTGPCLVLFINSEMVICFLASMSCCQIRVRFCIRGCGRL